MTQSGSPGGPPPPQGTPPPQPPPPPAAPSAPPSADWQTTPQQASAPQQPGGMPSWTANITSQAPVAGPAGFYYADVPNRIIAYIIDAIVIFIINFIVLLIVGGALGATNQFGQVNVGILLVVAIIGLAIGAAYFIYTWTAMRGTPGMKVLGMQIGHEQDGRSITYQQGFIRWLLLGAPLGIAQLLNPFPGLGILLSLASIVWLIVLLVTTAQSPTKQGLHDRYAHTMVVKAARAVG